VAEFQRDLTQAALPEMHPADRKAHNQRVHDELRRRGFEVIG